jgi:hypothetical protein
MGDDLRGDGKRGALRDRPRPSSRALELLDCALPRLPAEPRGKGRGGEPRDLARNDPLVGAQDSAALGRWEGIEEGDAGQAVVAGSGRRRRLQEPAAQLASAGRGDPVEISVGAAAGPEHPKNDESLPPQAGESGVDLRDLRLPDRLDFFADRAREVVTRTRLQREKAEEDVRERHRKNYINTDIDGYGPGFRNCPEKTKVKAKKKGARRPPQKSCGFVNR